MFESTAVWAEEKVYPEIDDYLNYVRVFAAFPGAPLTKAYPPDKRKSLKIYGSAVWNHWLDTGGGGYGVDVIRRAWEVSDVTKPADFSLASYDRAIAGAGGRSFGREFASFAAATAEWQAGLGNFPDHADVSGREAQAAPCTAALTTSSRSSTRAIGCSGSGRVGPTTSSPCGSTSTPGCEPRSRSSPATATRSPAG